MKYIQLILDNPLYSLLFGSSGVLIILLTFIKKKYLNPMTIVTTICKIKTLLSYYLKGL